MSRIYTSQQQSRDPLQQLQNSSRAVTGKTKLYLILSFFILISGILISCNDTNPQVPEKRDTGITVQNSYSSLFFDSLQLEKYIRDHRVQPEAELLMRDFYNVRNFQYAWFDKNGFNEQALNFWNLQRSYMQLYRDSSIYNPVIEMLADSVEVAGKNIFFPDSLRILYEFEQTRHFYAYASRAYQGNNALDPKELKWFIPRRKVSITAMLDSLVANKGRNIQSYEPVSLQYSRLREYLHQYSAIRDIGGWGELHTEKKKISAGDTAQELIWIRNRLYMSGDLEYADSTTDYTPELEEAVKRFQRRHGLKNDGVIGAGTIRQMNRPVDALIKQILINMERQRWLPRHETGDYLLVNIPEYRLHLFENGKHIGRMNVVVGSTQHNTVIFTDKLKYVVFSPYWNVPPGILKNEVLPGIARDPNYLARHNMEWHNGTVRQKPGINNSLGLVKFLFPNSYNIYLHDTPSKSLFNEDARAFSHGCIRVAEPMRLAEWILRYDTSWTREKMTQAMHAGKERFVPVRQEIPVIIGYFTSWVDADGLIQFRNDVYGHDAVMGRRLFSEE